jgi:hypothetical protein
MGRNAPFVFAASTRIVTENELPGGAAAGELVGASSARPGNGQQTTARMIAVKRVFISREL